MTPIGGIPRAPRFKLERHEIAQVICQVQFSPVLRITRSEDGVVPFQEAVRATYPRYSKQQAISIVVGPEGMQQQATPDAQHRLEDSEGRYIVTLASDFVALATAKYVDIDDFATRVETLVSAVAEHYQPAEMTRLGLRFINEFRLGATDPKAKMVEILNQGFLGASGAEELGDSLVSSQHLLELAGDSAHMMVRHGLNPGGGTTVLDPAPDTRSEGPFYLLDIDAFFQRDPVPFDVGEIAGTVREFNDQIRSFFAWAVKEQHRREQLGQVDL
ncbi:MAG: TIGR04255 family protein [Actinomycetota bacterium]|nr:TIGR04255 family protein [Actinomycetota bacterium]